MVTLSDRGEFLPISEPWCSLYEIRTLCCLSQRSIVKNEGGGQRRYHEVGLEIATVIIFLS